MYEHHAVYVTDKLVFQLGNGIARKHEAAFGRASFAEFLGPGGTPRKVEHPSREWWGVELPPAVWPDEIIRRAEFLEREYTPNRYNLVGNNCEHATNWCVTGWYSESHQVRSFWAANAFLVGMPLLIATGKLGRKSPPLQWAGVVYSAIGFVTVPLYNRHIRRFWQDIGVKWDGYGATHSDGAA